jgi:hypothetical protein
MQSVMVPSEINAVLSAHLLHYRYMYFQVCEGAAMSMAMRAIPGVHPTGMEGGSVAMTAGQSQQQAVASMLMLVRPSNHCFM